MIIVPGSISGTSTSRTQAAKAGPFIHCPAVHVYTHERGAVNDPWGDQPAMGQPRDQRLGAPTAEGRIHCQSLAPQGTAPQAG